MEKRSSISTVIYPGTFDPITMGHLDIIERASKLFGGVIVAVADAVHKRTFFPLEERLHFVREATRHLPGVQVERLSGLLVDFARRKGAVAIIRGLRAVSDFEYEFKMAWMNRRLCPEIETVFVIPSEEYAYLSASLVREIAYLGGDVRGLVPPVVARRLEEMRRKGEMPPPQTPGGPALQGGEQT